uniref:Uncharacterized protein n=1 Tax=Rhizophora mucronata TaxID=61149 RepID=A0A2P2J3G1_RHIMU
MSKEKGKRKAVSMLP